MCRKRNVSDGDSGFDSALSSRSSSISLDQESPEFGKHFFSPEVDLFSSKLNAPLRAQYQDILTVDEDIEREVDDLLLITNKVTGVETLFKPPSRLKFSSCPPEVATTHSSEDYDRNNSIPRSALFHARLEYELEKQIAKMDLVEVDLVMESGLVPPPSLGIRVIGVNMIHGVPDKLNIYVKRIVEDSVAGCDGRIRVNDHIVEVNGISLVGVSQKLAAQTLSNCAICPETGTVHFVLARPTKDVEPCVQENGGGGDAAVAPVTTNAVADLPSNAVAGAHTTAAAAAVASAAVAAVLGDSEVRDLPEPVLKVRKPSGEGFISDDQNFTQSQDSFLSSEVEPDFVGRDAVRLTKKTENEERSRDKSGVRRKVEMLRGLLRLSKITVLASSTILLSAILTVADNPKRNMI